MARPALAILALLLGPVSLFAQDGFTVSPTSWSVAEGGGIQDITVTSTLSEAPWTASSNASWLSVSVALGSGSGTVTLTAESNPTATARGAVATIAGHQVTVNQSAATPAATLDPTAWTISSVGGSLDVELTTADPDAPWNASTSAAWLTTNVLNGTGSATITLTAAPHTTSARPRAATATIAGIMVAVTQMGASPVFTLDPSSWDAPAAGGSQPVSLTSSLADAPWLVDTDASWLSADVPGPTSTAWIVETLAGGTEGYAEGTGSAARFSQPLSVAVDAAGNAYVADRSNNRIRKVTPEGVVSTLAGSLLGFADGTGAAALFNNPYGVAIDASGVLYVADTFNNRIRKVTPAGVVTTLAGASQGDADGTGASAQFGFPTGVAVDAAGFVYVADFQNSRIRKISPAGVVTTLAGSTEGYADGTGAAAQFDRPFGVAVTASGTVYVADSQNHRIRQVTPAGEVTTLAGSTQGHADGIGAAAQFRMPFGIAVDAAGLLYVADTLNNRVRQITTPAGEVTTLEGFAFTPDGVGPAPQFRSPGGLTIDAAARNIYVADSSNHRIQQWRLSPVGSATLSVTAQPTASVSPRGATITIGDETFTVTQDGGTAVFTIDPASWNVPAGGGIQNIAVTSNLADAPWTVSTTEPAWLTADVPTGVGSGIVVLTAAPTTTIAARMATATIAGHTVSVTQAAGTPSFGIDQTAWSPGAAGGALLVNVTSTLTDAPWNAASDAAWLIVDDSGGTGPGSVTLTAAAHTISALPRTATATIAGHTVTVTQAGAEAAFSLSPSSWNVSASGGSLAVTVTSSLSDAAWTASTATPWLSVGPGGGTGNGTVTITAAAHVNTSLRAGSVTIAGVTLTVTQGAAPTVVLDRSQLFFGATTTGVSFQRQTSSQMVRLTQAGAGTVTWTAVSNQPWLTVAPSSGTGSADLSISVGHVAGLPITGTADGQVTVTVTGASNALSPIGVGLNLFPASSAEPAIGVIDTPVDLTSGITGSIAVTGWALDDVEVVSVGIYRDPVAPEPAGSLVFIGNAVFVDGARLDLLPHFPRTPRNTRGGWGYMMLTNMLPNGGNGTFRLHAIATDGEGNQSMLEGSPRITVDNASSSAPFGAIDTPQQGQTVSGVVNNFGWVLVPDVAGARADVPGGGSVVVYINGVPVGVPGGWTNRADITQLFPTGYAALSSTVAVYTFDTGTLPNGVHTIAWGVGATNGLQAGVGSRYFTVSNGVSASVEGSPGASSASLAAAGAPMPAIDPVDLAAAPVAMAVAGRRGFDLNARYRQYRRGPDGTIVVDAEELDRVELRLGSGAGEGTYAAYLRVGAALAPLPIGAKLDRSSGTFTWQPGVGFVGRYDFVFTRTLGSEVRARYEVRVVLHPRTSGRVGPQTTIDTPSPYATLGGQFLVAGWAVDLDDDAATGVDAVHVWAYPVSGDAPIFLGSAAYGGRRDDVAALHGGRFARAGFDLLVDGLPPGHYDLAVFAWSTVTRSFAPARVVRVTVR